MEQLPGGFTLEIPDGCFPLSTDSMLLAAFASGSGRRILDLGAGCGTLGILLCSASPGCTVDGIELDLCAHTAAVENIRRNRLEHRMTSRNQDLRQLQQLPSGNWDCVVSNPPYYSGGPASSLTGARRDDTCPLSELVCAAGKALKFGGDFFVVHKPQRMAEIIALGAAQKLEAKELVLVRHHEGSPVSLVLLKLRKGAKPGLLLRDWLLFTPSGSPTELYRKIYHIRED